MLGFTLWNALPFFQAEFSSVFWLAKAETSSEFAAGGACPGIWNASTGVELAPLAGNGNVTYTVQPQDAPRFRLICQNGQGQHCQRGQTILVQLTCSGGAGAPAAEAPAAEGSTP
jgi:hypothetical protein